MGRRAVSIDELISRQEAVVLAMKKRYDASVEKLAKLVDGQEKRTRKQRILELLKTITSSFDKIKAFLKREDPSEEDE